MFYPFSEVLEEEGVTIKSYCFRSQNANKQSQDQKIFMAS